MNQPYHFLSFKKMHTDGLWVKDREAKIKFQKLLDSQIHSKRHILMSLIYHQH